MTLSDFIYHQHLRCRLWIAELNFFINELRIFHESIEYWEGVKSSAEAQKKIGHFKNDFETIRREIDATGAMNGMDAFNERALSLLTSSRLAEALDLSREESRVVERYGVGNPKIKIGRAHV